MMKQCHEAEGSSALQCVTESSNMAYESPFICSRYEDMSTGVGYNAVNGSAGRRGQL